MIVLDSPPAGRAGPPEPSSDLELRLLVPPLEPGEIVRRVAELLEGGPEALPKGIAASPTRRLLSESRKTPARDPLYFFNNLLD